MHRFTQQAVMLFTLLTLPPAVLADRTYNFLNYPALQSGWTLSGTITTDGTIGTIQATNILSWTLTGTSGATTFTVSSTDPGAAMYTSSGITATGAGLLVPFPNHGIGISDPAAGQALEWATWLPPDITMRTTQDWGSYSTPDIIASTLEPGSSAWLIASTSSVVVPEPSPLYIAGFGAVYGCVYVMGQKRRARRTATTEA